MVPLLSSLTTALVVAFMTVGLGIDARVPFGDATTTPLEPSAADSASAFDFLEGSWTTVKDGLSMTLTVRRALGGTAWHETTVIDDANTVVGEALFIYDEALDTWTQTSFLRSGGRSTYVGRAQGDGTVVLEQVSYAGRSIDPPQSRLVYAPGDEGFVLGWQSRASDGSWTPRSVPFVHERVDRPSPPESPGRIAFISNRSGNWDIYTMRPDGSDLRQVTQDVGGDHFPRWIAGNTRLAFRSQRSRTDGAWDRWEIDVDGSDPQAVPLLSRLNNPDLGEFPQLHPSGSYAVNAVERDGEQDLYIWRFDGGGERRIAPAPGLDYRPLFSPDGSTVLFVSERDGNAEIYTVAFDGSDLRRLTESAGIDRYARWSPDGEHIGFVSDRDGNLEVYVMGADGSDVRRLTHNDAEDGEISWSPDGRHIAFRSDASGNGEINVVEVASGEIVNLTRDPGYDGEPVWSPRLH